MVYACFSTLSRCLGLLFLKIFEDLEEEFRLEAELEGRSYEEIIDKRYRWSSWKGMDAKEMRDFIERSLSPYLREMREKYFSSLGGKRIEEMISSIFSEVRQHIRSPYALKEVVLMLDELDFRDPEDSHALSQVYEEILMFMEKEGGAAGEYYTPRPIVRLIVKIVDPRLGKSF